QSARAIRALQDLALEHVGPEVIRGGVRANRPHEPREHAADEAPIAVHEPAPGALGASAIERVDLRPVGRERAPTVATQRLLLLVLASDSRARTAGRARIMRRVGAVVHGVPRRPLSVRRADLPAFFSSRPSKSLRADRQSEPGQETARSHTVRTWPAASHVTD